MERTELFRLLDAIEQETSWARQKEAAFVEKYRDSNPEKAAGFLRGLLKLALEHLGQEDGPDDSLQLDRAIRRIQELEVHHADLVAWVRKTNSETADALVQQWKGGGTVLQAMRARVGAAGPENWQAWQELRAAILAAPAGYIRFAFGEQPHVHPDVTNLETSFPQTSGRIGSGMSDMGYILVERGDRTEALVPTARLRELTEAVRHGMTVTEPIPVPLLADLSTEYYKRRLIPHCQACGQRLNRYSFDGRTFAIDPCPVSDPPETFELATSGTLVTGRLLAEPQLGQDWYARALDENDEGRAFPGDGGSYSLLAKRNLTHAAARREIVALYADSDSRLYLVERDGQTRLEVRNRASSPDTEAPQPDQRLGTLRGNIGCFMDLERYREMGGTVTDETVQIMTVPPGHYRVCIDANARSCATYDHRRPTVFATLQKID